MTFLGIDLGTSGLRALLVDSDGNPIGATERHYEALNPNPGWSEQDPADWIEALEAAIDEMRATYPAFRELRAIGVAGHMHGATLLDADGRVLRPCILWNDTRSHAEAMTLDSTEGVRERSGNIVFPGFTAPKLDWVRKYEPETHEKVAKVLLPAAYLNFYLTGDYVADMSDSAGTSWLDVGERRWSEHLLDAGHMRADQMPRLVEGCEPAGVLRDDIARRWGVTGSVTIAGGAGDNAAAACGIGALDEGQGFVSLGTSGVLLAARDGYRPAPETAVHTFCHAIPDRWYQMGVMLSAADSLSWLARNVGRKPSELTEELGLALSAPSSVRFFPYLSGERTPHNDAEIRGGFVGLSTGTTNAELTRAVLEGVAFGLRDSFEALAATDAKLDGLIAIGGGSASSYWLQLISTVLGIPLYLPAAGEFGAALGAARLGMIASGEASQKGAITSPEIRTEIQPDRDYSAAYNDAYLAFRAAYPHLKALHRSGAGD